VGSRRGLERHQTLRQAVAWSYDLLDEAEKSLLARCSVFVGGFDLDSARAAADSDGADDYAVLDLLDALVRKSLLVADRSAGRTRFSMLETIRQFAEEQLVASGAAEEIHAAHARYFARCEADILALWDGPRQREAYAWFTVELANLRAAFRWASDHGEIDTAAAIAVSAAFLGSWVEQFEPTGWAEELIEPARAVNHRRLAQLYVMAAQCHTAGRIDEAIAYSEASRQVIGSGRFDEVPYDFETSLGGAYVANSQPAQWIQLCRDVIARSPDPHTFARASLVFALTMAGASEEAVAASEHLLAMAAGTDNPLVASWALLAYGFVERNADPAAYEALRMGLTIAQDSGNRQVETHHAVELSWVAAIQGDAMDALDYISLAIRNFYDAGRFSFLHTPLAILAAFLDRLGQYESAATISEFAATAFTRASYPKINKTIAHLRQALGDETYELLAHAGASMTNAAMATYAFEQIDQARAALNAVSE
jgi:hypothetical protein